MEPVRPLLTPGRDIVFAKDQPQYKPLPATICPDGLVFTDWQPTDQERAILTAGGNVRIQLWTFNEPLHPMLVTAVPPKGAPECADAAGKVDQADGAGA